MKMHGGIRLLEYNVVTPEGEIEMDKIRMHLRNNPKCRVATECTNQVNKGRCAMPDYVSARRT